MRKKYTIPIILLLVLSTVFSQTETFKLGFSGMYPNNYGYPYNNPDWSYYHDMNANFWQGWWIGGNTNNDATSFVLQKLGNENMEGYLQPDSLRWAGFGREQINYAVSSRDTRFNYIYQGSCAQIYNDVQFNDGKDVLYFDKNSNCNNQQNPGGPALWGIRENGFSSFSGGGYDPLNQVSFPYNNYNPNSTNRDSTYLNKWYMKPRMRVDVNDVMYGPNKEVIKVIINNYNGFLADSITIYTNDFKVQMGNYNGAYIEDFIDHNAVVFSDILNQGRPGNDPVNHLNDCQVDYQIYWYGTVSFWIDYVKVQDEAAYRLLNNDPNINFGIRNAITQKVNNIVSIDQYSQKCRGFYMEEIDYSNLACLEYLNKTFLPAITSNTNYRMVGLINPVSYHTHLHSFVNSMYEEYLTRVSPTAFITVFYPFMGDLTDHSWGAKLPNNFTLPVRMQS